MIKDNNSLPLSSPPALVYVYVYHTYHFLPIKPIHSLTWMTNNFFDCLPLLYVEAVAPDRAFHKFSASKSVDRRFNKHKTRGLKLWILKESVSQTPVHIRAFFPIPVWQDEREELEIIKWPISFPSDGKLFMQCTILTSTRSLFLFTSSGI